MLTPGWEESLLLNPKRTNKEKIVTSQLLCGKTKGLFGFSLGLLGTESWLTCDETIEDVGA